MKNKVLSIAFCFAIFSSFSFVGLGQNGYAPKVNSFGNYFKRLRADVIHVPYKATLTTDDIDTTPQIFVKNDTLFYFSSGTYKALGISAVYGGTIVTPANCPLSAATTIGATAQTTQVINWTAVGQNTYNISAVPTFGGQSFTASNVSPPYTITGLTSATAYTVYLTTVCTTGGTANYSTNNFTTSAGASIQFLFAYSPTDPYTDDETAPTLSSPTAYTIAHNANLSFTVPPASADNYLILKVPATESTKLSWYYNSLNSGTIPDVFTRAPFTVGAYTYYITRATLGRDPSTPTMQFTNP